MVPGTNFQAVPVNNHELNAEQGFICIVQDETQAEWKASKFHINLPRSTTVHDLYVETAKGLSYEKDSFVLVWKRTAGTEGSEDVELRNDLENMTLDEIGLPPEKKKQRFYLRNKDSSTPPISTKPRVQEQVGPSENADTDVLGDGSVSKLFDNSSTSGYSSSSGPYYGPSPASSSNYGDIIGKSETGFVGLVNQAMTCYLNSLLQTLFMTPEFRNAIYKWKFDSKTAQPKKSIPYQLQRLFVHLQFSSKRAVETTDVTKSFGWDSSDAWHQHDVQELCRVMFDALETVFKNTDQAHLINQLYQGKMKDYVKCLECGYESARNDTFLDIPLVIRPFGVDNIPHGSVEEALDAFVKAERLEGNNQYKCDKCEKLCDADKGLKFCSFPPLLTMQLKRFAFDFQLLHRVKLNDRLSFPQHLNLNKYVVLDDDDSISQKSDSHSSIETDSGVSLGCGSENEVSDEPNDVTMTEEEKHSEACGGFDDDFDENDVLQTLKGPEGPYMYELFSIMIHSGSAIGGHYYAYIKSFADNQWYSFNDQTVTKITNNDIKRAFGGIDSSRGYYSSHYSSSANAYMLMYRQIKADKAVFMSEEDLPEHVKELVTKMHEAEEREKQLKIFQKSVCRIKLFCQNPVRDELMDVKFEIHKDKTLKEATELARKLFDLEKTVSLENCRLVRYDEYNHTTDVSYEGKEDVDMNTILNGVQQTYLFDLLLETKKDEEEFPVYLPGGISVKVYEVNIEEKTVSAPVYLRLLWTDTVDTLQETIRKKLPSSRPFMRMMWERYSGDFTEIKPSKSSTLKDETFFKQNKIYVQFCDVESDEVPNKTFLEVLEDYSNSICLNIVLPENVYATESNVFKMTIQKRLSLAEFKEKLETPMGCSSELFKVFRCYSNNQEMEMDRLTDTFSSVPDQSKIIIKHGRALKQDEFRSKVFLLRKNEQEHTQLVLDTILSKAHTVLETKQILHVQLLQGKKPDIPVERMRLRKKCWKNPGRILKNEQKCDFVLCAQTTEVFLEELQGEEPVQNEDQFSIYIRRWRRSAYTFDPIEEVVVNEGCSVADFKTEISRCSDIDAENIEIAKGRGSFPFEVSVLEAEGDLEWNPKAECLRNYPIMVSDDGTLFYYRDKTEQLMELSDEKRNEIKKSENARCSATTNRSSYKPREKALKIYTDR